MKITIRIKYKGMNCRCLRPQAFKIVQLQYQWKDNSKQWWPVSGIPRLIDGMVSEDVCSCERQRLWL